MRSIIKPVNQSNGRRFIVQTAIFLCVLFVIDRGLSLLLESGLRRYWGLESPCTLLVVGHSRAILGIDEEMITSRLGRPTAKYAVNGATTHDRVAMVQHYIAQHPGVRCVIYDVEASTFASRGLSANSYGLFFPLMGDEIMGKYVRKHVASSFELGVRRVFHTARFDETTFSLAIRGLLGIRKNLKIDNLSAARLQNQIASGRVRKPAIDENNLRAFEDMARDLGDRGILLVLVDMPAVDKVNATNPKGSEEVRALFRRIAAAPHIFYLDYHDLYEVDYGLFHDGIHLNVNGKRAFTERLLEDLSSHLVRQSF